MKDKSALTNDYSNKNIDITHEEYVRLCNYAEHKSQWQRNTFRAFWVGGMICAVGQIMAMIYQRIGSDQKSSYTDVSLTLIIIAAFLTGIGVFDRVARYAGAGTLVPITGFANAVASPALEFKTEGYITGLGAKLFVICGPVILYGTIGATIAGILGYFL